MRPFGRNLNGNLRPLKLDGSFEELGWAWGSKLASK